jgi:hypothetical protein
MDGQTLLINACQSANVPRYVVSDWALDYTKLKLGELFHKDPMIQVKAYLDAKESVAGVHILIGGFMEPIFSPFFDIVDVQSNTFRYCGDGNEMMEGTTYDDAAKYTAKVDLDSTVNGVLKCKSLDFRYLSSIVTTLLHLSLGGRATIQEIARKLPRLTKLSMAFQ